MQIAEAKMIKKDIRIIISLVVVMLVIVAISIDSVNNKNSVEGSVKTAVLSQLKSPSTAKFPSFNTGKSDSMTLKMSDNVWHVYSYVDAQNSFGATVRSTFSATVTLLNGTYNVSELEIH